jgi:uncharacterized protein YheU (UPF0270 family)
MRDGDAGETNEGDPEVELGDSPIRVPWQELSRDALQGVIESFVLREGTDYGERELTMDAKCAQVRRALERGEAYVMFDPQTNSVSIVAAEQNRAVSGASANASD